MADGSSRSLLASHRDYPGKASFGRRSKHKTPLFIVSLVIPLATSTAASIIVLVKSNEDPVKSWKIRPSVLLSILAGIYAIALGGLFSFGVAVTWWRSITHGSTLKRLHYISAGANPKDFVSAFIAGSNARKVAIVALIVFVVKLAAGPLLQRSTRPEPRPIRESLDMTINLAEEIPDGWLGTLGAVNGNALLAQQQNFLNQNITTTKDPSYFCPANGTCDAMVPAAGINFGCSPGVNKTIDLLDPSSIDTTIFHINVSMVYDYEQPMLYLETQYLPKIEGECIGTLTTESCYFVPATVGYPIAIRDDIITVDVLDLIARPAVIKNYTSAADAQSDDSAAPRGPLNGLLFALEMFRSRAILIGNETGLGYSVSGERDYVPYWPDIFHDATDSDPRSNVTRSQFIRDTCPIVFQSPKETVIANSFLFLFRAAYNLGAEEQKYKQSFKATFNGSELRYITDFRFLTASVAVMILGNAAAMSLLWGWWQLNRYVTLSPLETGKALGAPILLTSGPEQEADSIIDEIGDELVAHDGDELIWSGAAYVTGSNQKRPVRGNEEQEIGEMDAVSSSKSNFRRGHRRGMSSVSNTSPSSERPSFEHSLGYTTRMPYEDEEGDVGRYGRQRSRSGGSDTLPMLPLSLTPGTGGSPKLPPIPPSGSIRMEPLSPVGRPRRGSAGRVGPAGSANGKRPLSSIVEGNSPTP